MPDLQGFLDELAAGTPVPGGGSVAALEVALAAALVAMVAGLTVGRKRYADVHEQALQIRGTAEALRVEAIRLVQEDVDAYATVAEAMRLPRDSDDQKAQRRDRMQGALKGAVGPPLRTMRVSMEVGRLAEKLSEIGNRSALSDLGTAVLAARAGFEGARLNVETNLSAIDDPGWIAEVSGSLGGLSDFDSAVTRVLNRVEYAIHGEADR